MRLLDVWMGLWISLIGFELLFTNGFILRSDRNACFRWQLSERFSRSVMMDSRYQLLKKNLSQKSTKTLIEECKMRNINISDVRERNQLEHLLVIDKLRAERQSQLNVSYSKRSYIKQLEQQIHYLKSLPNDKLIVELRRYNITNPPQSMEDKNDLIVLIAKSKIREMQFLDAQKIHYSVPKNLLKEEDEGEDDFDESLLQSFQKSNHKVFNDSLRFFQNHINEFERFAKRSTLTSAERQAEQLTDSNINSQRSSSSKEEWDEFYREALNLSSDQIRNWTESLSREALEGLLFRFGESLGHIRFTTLEDLRELFTEKLLEVNTTKKSNLVNQSSPTSPKLRERKFVGSGNRSRSTISQQEHSKNKTAVLKDILLIEKSLFKTILFRTIPQLFQQSISGVTIIMNEVLGIFARDSSEMSDLNIPNLFKNLPTFKNGFPALELPLLILATTIFRILKSLCTWAGSQRYSAQTTSVLVGIFTLNGREGLWGLAKSVVMVKLLTLALNRFGAGEEVSERSTNHFQSKLISSPVAASEEVENDQL